MQYSTVAMIEAQVYPFIVERVRYDAYGRARHTFAADVNFDGYINSTDQSAITGAYASIGDNDYNPDYDFCRNGVVASADATACAAWNGRVPVGAGGISDASLDHATGPGPDNSFGYCGYVFNPQDQLYCVRYRWYEPTLGRWLERDPLGFIDGPSMYEYCCGLPSLNDPLGLSPDAPPQWHHMVAGDKAKAMCLDAGIDPDQAALGRVFEVEAHGWRGPHPEWNAEVEKLIKRLKKDGDLTLPALLDELAALAGNKAFAPWFAKSVPADCCYNDWGKLKKPGEKLARLRRLQEQNAKMLESLMEHSRLRKIGSVTKRLKKIPGIGVVAGAVFFAIELQGGKKAFAACVYDNMINPLPIDTEDAKAFAEWGAEFGGNFMTNVNIESTQQRGTCSHPQPTPGERRPL